MQSLLFWAASVSAFVTFCVHTFVGGPVVARPLLADEGLPRASKWLNYYCWHITTVLLLCMSASYAYAAMMPGGVDVAAVMTALCVVLSALSAWVARKGRINPWRFPSTTLFAVTAIIAALGCAVAFER
jgi:hypothetical protein